MAFLDDVATFSCNGQSKTGTTLAGSITGAGAAIGKLVIVVVASDNAGTTDATGADNIASVTDSGGNTYTLAAGFRNGQAAAQGGSHSSVWYSVITIALSVGSTITVTNSTTAYARAFYARAYSFGAGNTISVAGSIGAAGDAGVDPVANLTGLTSKEYLFIGTASDENSSLIGSTATGWTYKGGLVTSGGGAAANMAVAIWIAIETGTGKSLTPATVGDAAALVVAFAEVVPPTADAWNKDDKTATVTLSNSDKTITNSAASAGGARSTQKYTKGVAGKYYAEFVNDVYNVSTGFGLKITTGSTPSTNTNTLRARGSGLIELQGVSTGINLGAAGTGGVFCLAWDAGASKAWMRLNAGSWNNSATADPTTGAEGIDLSAQPAGDYAAWGLFPLTSGLQTTLRTELAEFTQTVPSGFTSWMGETPTSGGVTVAATGVAAGSALGTVTVDAVAPVSFEAVGVAAATALGTATVTGKTNISTEASGAAAAASLGSATVSTVWNVSATSAGAAAGTALGTVTVAAAASASTTPAGQAAATALGNVSVAAGGSVDVAPTSVTATALSGAVTVVAKQAVSTTPTGAAALGVTGTVTVSGAATTTPTGQMATAALSSVTIDTVRVASITATGVAAGTALGGVSIAVGGGIDITPAPSHAVAVSGNVTVAAQQQVSTLTTGAVATALAGTASVSVRSPVAASGVAAAAVVGTALITANQALSTVASGVTASTVLGGVSVAAGGSVGVIAAGQAATASVGTASVTAKQFVTVAATGVGAATANGVAVASGTTNVTVVALGQQVMAAIGAVSVDTGAAPALGLVGAWNGAAWIDKPAKVWTGSAWMQKPVKTWNGSAWI